MAKTVNLSKTPEVVEEFYNAQFDKKFDELLDLHSKLKMPGAEELFDRGGPVPQTEDSVAWQLANEECARRIADAIQESPPDETGGDFGPGFYGSLRELHDKETVPADDLMIGVRRRQVTIFASVTNVGKTTVMLNHALAAAGGQSWLPLLPAAPERPLKIVFIDAESTDDELKKDTLTMLRAIGNSDLATENFIPVVDAIIDGEALNLSKQKHFEHIKRFLKYHQPDIAIFDTISALFTLYSENDNAEVVRKVLRPLKELAVAGNCAVWASHHIGKSGESDEAEEAYRGRGASSFGANVRGVITLRKEKVLGDGYVKLALGKSKGNKLDPVILKLDFGRRTFELCAAPTAPTLTPYQQVVGVFNGHSLKRAEVLGRLPKFKPATVDRYLKQAVENGELIKSEGGLYEKPQNPTPYRDGVLGFSGKPNEDQALSPDEYDWPEKESGADSRGQPWDLSPWLGTPKQAPSAETDPDDDQETVTI
jgi:AAA domain